MNARIKFLLLTVIAGVLLVVAGNRFGWLTESTDKRGHRSIPVVDSVLSDETRSSFVPAQPRPSSLPQPQRKDLEGQPALTAPASTELSTTARPPLADRLGALGTKPESEPQIVLEVLDAFRRSFGGYPAGEDNRQVVNALLGANGQKLPFIPKDHPRLNADGEMVDAWGTPFFFHLNSSVSVEVRSAGPDRLFFTSDDIVAKSSRSDPG